MYQTRCPVILADATADALFPIWNLLTVGLRSGSFTTSFGRAFGMSPTAYRASYPPASARVRIPTCVLQAYARPRSNGFREDNGDRRR